MYCSCRVVQVTQPYKRAYPLGFNHPDLEIKGYVRYRLIRIQHAIDCLAISIETSGQLVMTPPSYVKDWVCLYCCTAASTAITTGSRCGTGMNMAPSFSETVRSNAPHTWMIASIIFVRMLVETSLVTPALLLLVL